MIGYKGFDKDLKCNGKQYAVGKTFMEEKAKLCSYGMHFCENPLDCMDYYGPAAGSRYCEIETDDATDEKEKDSKRVCTTMKIKAEIGLPGLIKAGIEYIKTQAEIEPEQTDKGDCSKLAASGNSSQLAASGNSSKLAASGNSSKLAASGDYSQLAASGDCSQVSVNGEHSVGCAIGINSMCRGCVGSFLGLVEWKDNGGNWVPIHAKFFKVDGKKIKPDTWYMLKDGKAVKVE